MKRTKIAIIVFALIATVACLCLCACNSNTKCSISLNSGKSFVVEVGDEIDYTQYFIVKDKNGNFIEVTDDMLDLSNADTSKTGTFKVTLTYGGASKTATFIVVAKGSSTTPPGTETPPATEIPKFDETNTNDLNAIFAKYGNQASWNFAINLTSINDTETYSDYYEYLGKNVLNKYESEDGNTYTDYLGFNATENKYYFYSADSSGSYDKYAEGTDEYNELYSYLYLLNLTELSNYTFTLDGEGYVADNPAEAGNAIIYDYSASTYSWTNVTVYVAGGKITKIIGVMNDGYLEEYAFVKYNQINFTLPGGSSSGGTTTPSTPSDTMEAQTYNPSTFNKDNLQNKLLADEGMIGLPSVGTYKALVIPVQFKDDTTITQSQLTNLNIAFNGTETETGWESVKTYYQKASYGKLNLSFDIQPVFNASKTASDYSKHSKNVSSSSGTYTQTGEELVLLEALAYYESRLNLSDYDYNGDGCIDAVYLIYSADVDYGNGDFFWAYTTWYSGDETFDNLNTYYYFFAGFDFMDESTANDSGSGQDRIPGLKVNAATYIHETGHLLGLDDYYDYKSGLGCNEGLGSADMMDYTVGDHNVYSKIMLGWLEPQIVTSTQTITISSSQAQADAVLIPLNFDNSYFCEYLLIDLYAAQGLNKLHSSVTNSYLYGGAQYGVRIYHVSSSCKNPWSDKDYSSFTDYNNSTTNIALIKLVEADGDKKFSSSDGWAAESDLWQTGDKLSDSFSSYTRNDGKKVNFDIQMVSVTATSATITISFN